MTFLINTFSNDILALADNTQIVQLRNPHGEGEWLGDYSDQWLDANKESMKRITDDGKFFSENSSFESEFRSV